MAPEIRSILRYMDDFISSGDYSSALDRALQALKIYDEEREFENSIQVLEKLVSMAELQNNDVLAARYVDILRVRVLLARDHDKFNEINNLYSELPETPLSQIFKDGFVSDNNIIVETIEKQNLFGEFSLLKEIPYMSFQHHEDALKLIEEFFDEGRYLINLLDRSTSLHQALSLDIGNPEDVNIVDRDHIFKIQ